jgi:hypothetical protein
MKFKRVLETIDFASGKASDGVRTLAFAGFALLWVFKRPTIDGSIGLDRTLLVPAAFLVLALIADVAQYLAIVSSYRGVTAPKRPEGATTFDAENENVAIPRRLRTVPDWAFGLKVAFVATAHVMLIFYAFTNIR